MRDPARRDLGRLDRDALLDLTGDPFVRYALPPDALALAGPSGWACLGRWRPHGHWEVWPEWFSTVGEGREIGAPPGLNVDGSGRWAQRTCSGPVRPSCPGSWCVPTDAAPVWDAGLTAELTRRSVAERGVSTLGVYADNQVALRLDERLGHTTAHHLHTRTLVPAAATEAG